MSQIADTHCRLEFVHLGISAYISHFLRAMESEVLLIIQQLYPAVIFVTYCAAFDGMEHLSSVEAEHGGISEAGRGHALVSYAKGMSSIVDHLQTILFRNHLNGPYVTQVSVHMHWHDSHGFIGDQALQLGHIHGVVPVVYIAEHRYQSITHYGMSSRCKCEWCGNHFSPFRQVQRPNSILQRQMTVGIEGHMGNTQVFL